MHFVFPQFHCCWPNRRWGWWLQGQRGQGAPSGVWSRETARHLEHWTSLLPGARCCQGVRMRRNAQISLWLAMDGACGVIHLLAESHERGMEPRKHHKPHQWEWNIKYTKNCFSVDLCMLCVKNGHLKVMQTRLCPTVCFNYVRKRNCMCGKSIKYIMNPPFHW